MDSEQTKPPQGWWVYLVTCSDNSLYCGVSTDPERRTIDHNESTDGAKYTRSRRPVKLVYTEGPMSKSEALRREFVVKLLTRPQKQRLANGWKKH